MTNYFFTWIQNIAFYMIIITAVQSIVHGKDYQKYIRFYTGLVIIIITVGPLMNLFGMEEDFYRRLSDIGQKYEEQEKEIEGMLSEAESRIFSSILTEEEKSEKKTVEVEDIQIDP